MNNESWAEMSIGKRLRMMRIDKKIKIKTIADAIGVNAVSYSRWENDAQMLSVGYVNRICDVLGCSASVLFGQIDPYKVKDYEIISVEPMI